MLPNVTQTFVPLTLVAARVRVILTDMGISLISLCQSNLQREPRPVWLPLQRWPSCPCPTHRHPPAAPSSRSTPTLRWRRPAITHHHSTELFTTTSNSRSCLAGPWCVLVSMHRSHCQWTDPGRRRRRRPASPQRLMLQLPTVLDDPSIVLDPSST
jgi:hypothetical protein